MNQYFSESISLDLLYRTLGMIIVKQHNKILYYLSYLGMSETSIKRGGGEWVHWNMFISDGGLNNGCKSLYDHRYDQKFIFHVQF